jgi:hypothetical protein
VADEPTKNSNAGSALEAAASRTGLIVDPASIDPVGAWARDTDRLCIVPGEGDRYRIGALIDYGGGQGCAASGTASRSKDKIDIRFGACRIEAKLTGDRIVFPGSVPGACDSLCTGRASLAAMAVDHLSTSVSEAATLRTPDRTPLCPS